ncbi:MULTISPECIES: gliding motility lipoprotein GldD [unclassified Olleya]|jgi:gliding motility-associated lipoprotein GldD|uniref:gliding motility lipoprotein GldD n=1 Tax=unclassified Olleya TaxID=2615019 RepID=UPI0011A8BE5B|nr:gliding motility lipoprotein GldD [Olleya sp. Hel_I_94]TVZ47860.1 gliding motility-associated lipoprotein GldD [Olleya sp. Hel_I_94]|tara:strand:+ start:5533 stop:6111 length:579 start_codon:yes stop_codon:yes gene_type:complete
MRHLIIFLLTFVLLTSCGNDPIPKPKGYLRLEYPQADYKMYNQDLPFAFDRNMQSDTIIYKPLQDDVKSFGLNIEYKKLKGTIYLTYKAIDGKERLVKYLKNAQNFTQEHTKKADAIEEVVWENPVNKVYGMFYEVGGNAASQSQFYITDSINHFLTGSLYFYAKPNYDSILPAANYLQKDIKRIMESVQWK